MIGLVPFVIKNLKRRKLRSWLTIIGVIVGVLAIVSLMSLAQGLQDSITSEFDRMGARKITVASKFLTFGGASESGFTNEDVQEIERIFDVDFVVPAIESVVRINYNNELSFINITGYKIDNLEEFFEQEDMTILRGACFSNSRSRDIIVGYDYYNDYENLFKRRIDVGTRLRLGTQTYNVVGVLDDTGDQRKNRRMFVSIENIREITNVKEEIIDKIYVIIKENRDIEAVGERIDERLDRFRGRDDYDVNTPARTAEQQREILNIVSIVVIGIASISLLVGGVGIMNSMYTSVVERKKEIGILKAIGAKNTDILTIFLLEAGIIGLIGGFLGTLGGIGLAISVSVIADLLGAEFAYSINPLVCFFGLGFSFLVGIISGFLPAYQASKHEPIESLREE